MKNSGTLNSRTRNFRNRLQVEREVLQVINTSKALPQLAGLTAGAIETWAISASKTHPENLVTEIKAILVMIARITGTISDNSRAIVSEDEVGNIRLDLVSGLRSRVQAI